MCPGVACSSKSNFLHVDVARALDALLGFQLYVCLLTFEMMLSKDKLWHVKNFKSLLEQKLIQWNNTIPEVVRSTL